MEGFSYEEWLTQVPESIKQDPLWSFHVYPKSLLLSDMVWEDTSLMRRSTWSEDCRATGLQCRGRLREY